MKPRQVVVIGAGPAGSATAHFLAQAGVDTLLLDKASFPRDKTCGDATSPRAIHVIRAMGLGDIHRQASFRANRMAFYAPNGRHSTRTIPSTEHVDGHVLVLPRLKLDHMLLQAATTAGAEFRQARVDGFTRDETGRIDGVTIGKERIGANVVVIATGASTGLLKAAAMLPRQPRLMVAARQYFTGLRGLTDELEFYFNHVDLPGYGWMFPTGPDTANVGVGYIGTGKTPLRTLMQRMMSEHPRLRHLLADAQPAETIRSYPLRVDFHRAVKMQPGVVGVGEAIGLVNPFTGEGIDYALESGQMAARHIAAALQRSERPGLADLQSYADDADARFRHLFVFMTRARQFYYNRPMLNRIFGRPRQNNHLLDVVIKVSFSNGSPSLVFAPRTLFALATP